MMKKYLVYIIGVLLLAACTTDSYESGDGDLSYLRSDFGVAESDAQKKLVSFTTDDDRTFTFAEPLSESWVSTPDSTYRVVVYYDDDDSKVITPMGVGAISVIWPKPLKTGELMMTDPVNWTSCWVSTNKKYINLGLDLMLGSTDDDNKQIIGLVKNLTTNTTTGHKHYHMTFYHNQNNVPEYYSQSTFVSIPTEGFTEGDSLTLSVNTYSGIKTKAFAFE